MAELKHFWGWFWFWGRLFFRFIDIAGGMMLVSGLSEEQLHSVGGELLCWGSGCER